MEMCVALFSSLSFNLHIYIIFASSEWKIKMFTAFIIFDDCMVLKKIDLSFSSVS